MTIAIPVWPFVYGAPHSVGVLRSEAADFIVDEKLSFTPSGKGEHVFLQIQKTGENTDYVARQIARFANVRQRDIGYAGLKDRHAVTTQWFSVWLPSQTETDWSAIDSDNIKVLNSVRHARKLKRGVLSGNHFEITIRNWQGDHGQCLEQLLQIKANGIANYYGEQRFGNLGHNVNKALAMFTGAKVTREQRSLYLSAVRSYLFNQILSVRVTEKTWNLPLVGDTFMFDGSHSSFKTQQLDDDIIHRLKAKIIHPTGILWGKGDIDVSADAYVIERQIIENNQDLADGLVASGLAKARRTLRVNVGDLQWQFLDQTTLRLTFSLPAGSYATSLLREVVEP